MSRVRLGETPSLKKLEEGENYSYSTVGEEAESYRIESFGRIFSITRHALQNDDLGAFSSMGDWGAAAARLESRLFWDILTDKDQKTSKGNLLFSGVNKATAEGQKLTVANISAARLKMARQTGIDKRDGECLDIHPEYLIVPPELQTQAEQLLSRDVLPNKDADINPFKGAFSLIVSPWIKDAKTWILAAGRGQGIPLIEMAYLEGRKAPHVEWKTSFENDSIAVKARMDIGAKAIDHRGFYKGGYSV